MWHQCLCHRCRKTLLPFFPLISFFLSFSQSLDALQRCWCSCLGLRFAHCQQESVKASGPNWANGFFLKGWGLSQHLRDGYFGDYNSICGGICRKQNPRCGVRCHSHAYPSVLAGTTFQTFPGQIQFAGLLYRWSISLLTTLALVQSAGPRGWSHCLSGAAVQTHMDTKLLPTWKVKREMG